MTCPSPVGKRRGRGLAVCHRPVNFRSSQRFNKSDGTIGPGWPASYGEWDRGSRHERQEGFSADTAGASVHCAADDRARAAGARAGAAGGRADVAMVGQRSRHPLPSRRKHDAGATCRHGAQRRRCGYPAALLARRAGRAALRDRVLQSAGRHRLQDADVPGGSRLPRNSRHRTRCPRASPVPARSAARHLVPDARPKDPASARSCSSTT